MKKYQVDLSANAESDLLDYYRRAAKHAPNTAKRWLERFYAALESLSTMPERWPVAREEVAYQRPLRQMLFGNGRNVYRVLFTIVGDRITVLHVRRSTMGTATPAEIDGLG